jgi:hypothetical protein
MRLSYDKQAQECLINTYFLLLRMIQITHLGIKPVQCNAPAILRLDASHT